MRNKFFISALLTIAGFSSSLGAKKVSILADRSTVLTFPAAILDVDVDATYYAVSIKGASLLIRPKVPNAPTRTLLVRYGKDSSAISYVADISTSLDAPSHWQWQDLIQTPEAQQTREKEQVITTQATSESESLFENLGQQYWHLGAKKGGITVLVPQIILHEKETYVKIWIKNDTQTFLKLQAPAFENVSYTWKYLVWRSKTTHPASCTLSPEIQVDPKSCQSFIFAFPTFVTSGGIDVYLREDASEGLRDFKFNIPADILLQAARK
jgi:hypothetical protein